MGWTHCHLVIKAPVLEGSKKHNDIAHRNVNKLFLPTSNINMTYFILSVACNLRSYPIENGNIRGTHVRLYPHTEVGSQAAPFFQPTRRQLRPYPTHLGRYWQLLHVFL